MDNEKNEKLLSARRQELLAGQLYNSKARDTAIIVLSSTFLIPLLFIDDTSRLGSVNHQYPLFFSCFLFVFCIISVIVSFSISNKAINRELDIAEEYYGQGGTDNQESQWARFNRLLNNWIIPVLFGSALLFLLWLVVVIN